VKSGLLAFECDPRAGDFVQLPGRQAVNKILRVVHHACELGGEAPNVTIFVNRPSKGEKRGSERLMRG
jgi:hypothetical protein